MARKHLWTPLLVVSLLCVSSRAAEQERVFYGTPRSLTAAAPEEAPSSTVGWSLEIAVANLAARDVLRKIENPAGEDLEEVLLIASRFREVVGLDPLKDIDRIRIAGDASSVGQLVEAAMDPEPFLSALTITADLRQPGNLEGILLAFPGYTSAKRGEETVHVVKFEDLQVHIAFRRAAGSSPEGPVTVVASLSEEKLLEELKRLSHRAAPERSPSDKGASVEDDNLLVRLRLSESVLEKISGWVEREAADELGIGAGALPLIKSFEVTIADEDLDDGLIQLQLVVTIRDEDRAHQVQQLIKAGVGFLDFSGQEEPELSFLSAMAKEAKFRVDGCEVRVHIPVDVSSLFVLLSDL